MPAVVDLSGLPLADLQELQSLYIQVLKDLATAGQSYSFPGRSFTRVQLGEVTQLLADVNTAIAKADNTRSQIAYARIDTQCRFNR